MEKKKRTQVKQNLKERGITLIALIITIIVLLILAGVVLATLTGDSGILSNAEKAKDDTLKANLVELVKLAITESRIEGRGEINFTTLNEELNKIGNTEEDINITTLPATVIIDGVEIEIDEYGNIEIVAGTTEKLTPTREDFFTIDEETGYISVAIDRSENHDGVGYYYDSQNKKILSEEHVVIPSTINGIVVKGIIGGKVGGFYNASNLKSVVIPDTVEKIEFQTFYNCTSLTNVEIPNSVTSIELNTFYNCTSLTNVEIPNSVTIIGERAFENCTSLTNVKIPNGVTTISGGAFSNCTSLTNVEIPNSVTLIGERAFENCTSLTNVKILNGVTSIGYNAFSGCTSLTNVEIPNSVTSIGKRAFSGCTSLTNVEISNSVTVIDDRTFEHCTSLTNVEIPNSVTSIKSHVFWDCTSLKDVKIPNSVTSIDATAFSGCQNMKNIEYLGTKGEWNSIGGRIQSELTGVTVQCSDGNIEY